MLAVHKRATAQLGMTVHYFDYRQPEDVSAMPNAIAATGIKAMFYQGDPVEEPTSFEFVINLKTTKAIGLVIPQSALLRASAVVE